MLMHHKSHIMPYFNYCSTCSKYCHSLPYFLSGDYVENDVTLWRLLYGYCVVVIIIGVWRECLKYMENLMSERKSDQRSTLLDEIIVWRDGTPGEESKALSIRGHS